MGKSNKYKNLFQSIPQTVKAYKKKKKNRNIKLLYVENEKELVIIAQWVKGVNLLMGKKKLDAYNLLIQENVKKGLELISVLTVEEVLKLALCSPLSPIEWVEVEAADSVPNRTRERGQAPIITH